jgi:hypothetical protein
MASALRAAALYFALVFSLGFVLGTIRTIWLAPRTGPLLAVLAELPLILAGSWFICRWLLRRMATPLAPTEALAMGEAAFFMLMVAEFVLASMAFGQSPLAYMQSWSTPHGILGLVGQLLFGMMPLAQTLSRVGKR